VPLSFEVKNSSFIPLCCELVIPNYIEIINKKEIGVKLIWN